MVQEIPQKLLALFGFVIYLMQGFYKRAKKCAACEIEQSIWPIWQHLFYIGYLFPPKAKGQTISKANYGVLNFPKKRRLGY
jgi:hypothetical protein